MKIVLDDRTVDSKAVKQYIMETLIDMAKEDPMVVTVDADLRLCLGDQFEQAFPKRAYDCGIQEANMIGVAAGLSATGMKPFAHSFAPFATRRVYDVTFLTAGYGKLNVKILGSEAGVCAEQNGGTHMGFEDIGLMRMVPGAMVFDVCDGVQMAIVLRQIKDIYGVQYIRFSRNALPKIYKPETEFELGKGIVLQEGGDATVIACGIMVFKALQAAEALEKEGIEVTVVDMFTCKPIDKGLIVKCAEKTGAIVTAENHNIIGGLGSAVAEVLVESKPTPMERVGVPDRFGEVGDDDYLCECMELTPAHIAAKVKKAISRKR